MRERLRPVGQVQDDLYRPARSSDADAISPSWERTRVSAGARLISAKVLDVPVSDS